VLGKVARDWCFGPRVAIDHHQVAELTDRERGLADLAVVAAFIGATNRIGIALSVPPNPEYTGVPK
jgi:alkylhydroperoxidase family enzyme